MGAGCGCVYGFDAWVVGIFRGWAVLCCVQRGRGDLGGLSWDICALFDVVRF